jgi:hypothetical protein
MIHKSFSIMRLFFHSFPSIFNTFLLTLCKTLYTNAVKFPASTSEHVTKTFSIRCHLQNGIHVLHPFQGQTGGSRRVPVWAVSGMGMNSPSHFCDCLTCAQAGVRPSIVVKEKDVFHFSVRMNSSDVFSQFV